ncbi:GNAT family N-acetyltransferase [Reyranella sp. CPCC 100927]|uniref:GNAT family N-acetyltransferase n=1 Tax=Reyranella sp. CPCC 100927 TaxID=2599616 RepID=UPI0011B7D41E|nr:GNAT family N-acetyltransferase [Reyranella sp. CPCC 100927]TWS98517.1 GNAT family N-acetyltransferase [Reyranella sp. CPCC 100927]
MSTDGFRVSADRADVDLDTLHHFLSTQTNWARNIPREVVMRSLEHSLCFTLLDSEGRQRGFARVTTDRATFAYLNDVYVDADLRGQGLSRLLMDAVHAHPDLQDLRRWLLATNTAPWLYEKYGWSPLIKPTLFMERHDPDVYQRGIRRKLSSA